MVACVPAEIVDTVIDQLFDDKPTLATCALVSWAWVPRSRFRLFQSITYQADPDGGGFTPFLDFLRSSPELGALIHELTLDGLIKVCSLSGKGSREHEAVSYSILLDILDSLPALSDLELRQMWFHRPHAWTKEEHQRFGMGTTRDISLRKLSLHAIGYLDSDAQLQSTLFEFGCLLSIFSSVQELRVHRLPLIDVNSAQSQVKLRNPLYNQKQPFTLIAAHHYYADSFWETINRVSAPVRSLTVKSYALGRINDLKHTDTELKHLALNCLRRDTFSHGGPIRAEAKLSDCVALTSIEVWAHAAPRFWENIISLLPSIPVSLQRLTLYLCCATEDCLLSLEVEQPLGWEEIRRGLDRLPKLKELSFIAQHHTRLVVDLPTTYNRKAFDKRLGIVLEQELSTLRERGILSVYSNVVVKFGPLD